jgi:membrane protein YdbS with pleckstrin-like domain
MVDVFNSNEDIGEPVVQKFHEGGKNVEKIDNFKDKKLTSKDLPTKPHSPLSSFFYYPDKVKFVNEDPEEKVILLLRRHPITNFHWILISFFLLIAPAFISVFSFFESLPGDYQTFFFALWYLITFGFMFEKFINWYFNVKIVTDERIIDVDFTNLLFREVSDANIDQIQEVSVEMGGAIRTFFNYGEVLIQTAAELPQIEFEAVPYPDKVAKVLRELRVEEETEKLEGRIR